jgi:ubiquitin carboxyl-terminal hydrolase 5/13
VGQLPSVIDGVLKAATFSRREEIKAWEQELVPCEHTLLMAQEESRKIDSQGLKILE